MQVSLFSNQDSISSYFHIAVPSLHKKKLFFSLKGGAIACLPIYAYTNPCKKVQVAASSEMEALWFKVSCDYCCVCVHHTFLFFRSGVIKVHGTKMFTVAEWLAKKWHVHYCSCPAPQSSIVKLHVETYISKCVCILSLQHKKWYISCCDVSFIANMIVQN